MVNLKEDIKKTKKPVIGLERTLKKLRKKEISKIYVSSNSHSKTKILNLGKVNGVEIVLTEENSKEIGILCKKPYSISVISFE